MILKAKQTKLKTKRRSAAFCRKDLVHCAMYTISSCDPSHFLSYFPVLQPAKQVTVTFMKKSIEQLACQCDLINFF